MGYVGNQTSNSYTSLAKQTITGDGGASYTLDHAVANVNEIEVFVNNVRQEPSVAYTVSGTALTMTGNVAASDDFYVVFQGKAIQTTVHPEGQDLKAGDGTFSGNVTVDRPSGDGDGAVLTLQKNSTTFGTVTVKNGDMNIGNGITGLRFNDASDIIHPFSITANASTDNLTDFGTPTTRIKDLYLGGGLYVGGTGSANHLDDYEEGTFTPSFNGYTTGMNGEYVKIGRQVTCRIMRWNNIPASSITGNVTVTGLPFSASLNVSNNGGSQQNTAFLHIRAASTGIGNAPWGMVSGTSLILHDDSSFGSSSVYASQSATWSGTRITQNGTTSVIIDWVFTYLTG